MAKSAEKRGTVEKAKEVEERIMFVETPFDANLKCSLTPEEVMEEAEKMARLQLEISAKEDEASSVSKRYKSEIEALLNQQDVCAGRVRDKFVYRTVPCVRRLDWQTSMVYEKRNDTQEVFLRRAMSVAESQLQLQLEEEKKKEEAAI